MKRTTQILMTALLSLSLVFTSCRKEETEIIDPAQGEVVGVNASVTQLMQNTTTNDGSYDNIIDGANCFDIQLPFSVIANNIEVTIETEDDIDQVEDIFDQSEDDTDTLQINFPITIILADYTEVVINNQEELNAAAFQCPGENEVDDDIECIDFVYPITALIYNENNELIDSIILNNDEEFYEFLDELDEDIIVTFDFPITVILWNGTSLQINNFDELEEIIEEFADACDEDDDNDPNDDDCEDCDVEEVTEFITGCPVWVVDKLERDGEDLDELYADYEFEFLEDGGIVVTNDEETFEGAWALNGEGNDIIMEIEIDGLEDFNDAWELHEIEEEDGELHFDLRLGDDRLRFESDCESGGGGGGGNTDLEEFLMDGEWIVALYDEDGDNQTSDYNGFVLDFMENGTVRADNGSDVIEGTWQANGEEELVLDFGTQVPFDEFNDEWDVVDAQEFRVEVIDISGGNGGTDTLVFEKL